MTVTTEVKRLDEVDTSGVTVVIERVAALEASEPVKVDVTPLLSVVVYCKEDEEPPLLVIEPPDELLEEPEPEPAPNPEPDDEEPGALEVAEELDEKAGEEEETACEVDVSELVVCEGKRGAEEDAVEPGEEEKAGEEAWGEDTWEKLDDGGVVDAANDEEAEKEAEAEADAEGVEEEPVPKAPLNWRF